MNIKTNIQLLSEAAAIDNELKTDANYTLDTVKEAYKVIPEVPEAIVTEAADVVVTQLSNGDYYCEMVNLAPFMIDAGINNIAEALDLVASAYNLPEKSVGLVIESQERIDSMLEAARKSSQEKKNPKIMKKAADKVNKNNAVAAKLMKQGYKVAKKNASSKVCPKCGKVSTKCKCVIKETADMDSSKLFGDTNNSKTSSMSTASGSTPNVSKAQALPKS